MSLDDFFYFFMKLKRGKNMIEEEVRAKRKRLKAILRKEWKLFSYYEKNILYKEELNKLVNFLIELKDFNITEDNKIGDYKESKLVLNKTNFKNYEYNANRNYIGDIFKESSEKDLGNLLIKLLEKIGYKNIEFSSMGEISFEETDKDVFLETLLKMFNTVYFLRVQTLFLVAKKENLNEEFYENSYNKLKLYISHFTLIDIKNIEEEVSNKLENFQNYKYDKLNRCISKEFSDGVKSDFVYEGDRLVEIVLPSGSIRYEYDEYGRVLKQTLDENISESFVYDSMNRVLEYTDIFGNVSGYEYNQNGRVKAVNLGDDVKYIYTYDKLGRPTEESRLAGDAENKIYYDYDDLGRVSGIRTDTGRENTYSYDNEGNITSIKDSIGNTNYFKYGVGNTLEKVVDSDGLVSEYSYDKMYNLVGIRQYKKDNENDCMTRSYHRNNMGRIFKIENADSTYKTMDYNSLGQLVKNIDEDGFKTELKYNETGLLTSMKCSDGNYVDYEYDSNRFLKAVSGSFGSMSFERDKKGLVKKALTTEGHSIAYEYDKLGRTVAIVYPDGKKVGYNYDKKGRLIETVSGNEHIRLTYNSLGRIESREYSDGSKTCYEYNDIGSPTKITHISDEKINMEYTYTYDLVENKTGISINKNGSVKDYNYSYDEVGRITKVVLDGKMLREYSYDIFGNRTDKVEYSKDEVITTKYIYKGGKLAEERIAENNGLIQKRYEYDKRGNLIKKFSGGELEAEYKYN